MTPTDERIARLPKWARVYIEGLEDRIDRDGSVDLRPGAVNWIVQTRREMRAARMLERHAFNGRPKP